MIDVDNFFGQSLFSSSKKDQRTKRAAERLIERLGELNTKLETWITKGKFDFDLSLITYQPNYLDKYSDFDVVGRVPTDDGTPPQEVEAWMVSYQFHERLRVFYQLSCIAESRGAKVFIGQSQYGMNTWRSNYNITL